MNKCNPKAAEEETRCYSDSEIASIRQQLTKANAEAREVFTAEKYPLHPRIAAARAAKAVAQ